jgi:hypothetical protein
VQNRRLIAFVLAFGLIIGFSNPTYAAAKKFKNCTELNKVYPGGVARPGAVNKGGTTQNQPTINAALYKANIKSDRDKDGIACEK